MTLLPADQVSGWTPEGSDHYAQAHLFFGFERESYLMPAPEQRVVNCPCGASCCFDGPGRKVRKEAKHGDSSPAIRSPTRTRTPRLQFVRQAFGNHHLRRVLGAPSHGSPR